MSNRIVINSRRSFSYDGNRYYVNGRNGKYVLCIDVDGMYKILEDIVLLEVPTFETIKDAKRHFLFNHELLAPLEY